MNVLLLRNRQKKCRTNLSLLRKITRHLIREISPGRPFELAIHLVEEDEMAALNESFLQHEGSTDVITFDHADVALGSTGPAPPLAGEIFVCLPVAVRQARQFRTAWQSELVRYVVHGLLHLAGFDDLTPADRRKMKQQENRLVNTIAKIFPIPELNARPRRPSSRS